MRKKCTVTLKKATKYISHRKIINRAREKLDADNNATRINDYKYVLRYNEDKQPEIIEVMHQYAMFGKKLVKVKIEYSSASYFKKKQFSKLFGEG